MAGSGIPSGNSIRCAFRHRPVPDALMSAAHAAPAPQQVDIPLSSRMLHGQLYKPDGEGPFPTVIALHGCGGLGGHYESVLPRYRDWAEQLLKAGNAVCCPTATARASSGRNAASRRSTFKARRERVTDIAASRAWLVKQSWVARDRVSLIGWANGASALLWAVRPQSLAREPGRIFARRSRSIRIAGSPPASAGAHGCRPWC